MHFLSTDISYLSVESNKKFIVISAFCHISSHIVFLEFSIFLEQKICIYLIFTWRILHYIYHFTIVLLHRKFLLVCRTILIEYIVEPKLYFLSYHLNTWWYAHLLSGTCLQMRVCDQKEYSTKKELYNVPTKSFSIISFFFAADFTSCHKNFPRA